MPSEQPPIPLSVPEIRGNEWEYIRTCLETGWVSSVGAFVDRFERQVAEYTGAQYAIATMNGTAALHVALLIAGVQPDDEVLVSDLTFIASANAICYAQAWPVFIDAEPRYWQMDPQKLADFLQRECAFQNGHLQNKSTGRRIRAILPVHILGHPCDLDAIRHIARQYDLPMVEDAAEALGTKYKTQAIGATADIACFSFNGNKIITTGGGGMIVTNRADWANRARYLTTQAKDDPVEFIHGEIGFNYRLSNIQAAMGCAQLERLPDCIRAKQRIAKTYTDVLSPLPGLHPHPTSPWAFHTHWLYTLRVDPNAFGTDSRTLQSIMHEKNIQTRPLWQPMHLSPAHAKSQAYHCDTAEKLYRESISLPCSVSLSGTDQQRVIETIHTAYRQFRETPLCSTT